MTFEQIQKANDTIATITLEKTNKKTGEVVSKEYAEVNQRVKAFRMCYPEGFIRTEIYSLIDGVVTMQTKVGYYENGQEVILATGYAQEKESSSFINQTSFIENAETSSCGRALGFCGFGIDTSIASAEEVKNAIVNQDKKAEQKAESKKVSEKQLNLLNKIIDPSKLESFLKKNGVEKLEDLPMEKGKEIIQAWTDKKAKESKDVPNN